MEKIKYSIIACAYSNAYQFGNFIWTACNQDFEPYEVIVVDNATPDDSIYRACQNLNSLCLYPGNVRYIHIKPQDKRCTNITQGVNMAAAEASGEYLVIVADSNVLLSFNLLSEIDKKMREGAVILSAGKGIDVKISPNGNAKSEYLRDDPGSMMRWTMDALEKMGWPCDPIDLDLSKVPHRWPQAHYDYDCYIIGIAKRAFLSFGGYGEGETEWGTYHAKFVQNLTKVLYQERLKGVRVLHQYHRVFKDASA